MSDTRIKPNYRSLFVIGLSFMGAGLSLFGAEMESTGIALFGVGTVFFVIGISNRKHWGIPKSYARGDEAFNDDSEFRK